ncbi:hypothetical protein HU200_002408 [Digitaria exilis]|uniref:DUF1618 domain-containing protein n=1 Tax=Digitaria exilis TaxID=1010633 RepID=A0A835KV66_9POAL|nr:hypothetical protein HU200_002408 [Digitaria exilis]
MNHIVQTQSLTYTHAHLLYKHTHATLPYPISTFERLGRQIFQIDDDSLVRKIDFSFDAEEWISEGGIGDGEREGSRQGIVSHTPFVESTIALLGTMKAVPFSPQPPSISTFRLLGSEPHRKVAFGSNVACSSSTPVSTAARAPPRTGATSSTTPPPPDQLSSPRYVRTPLVRYDISIGEGAVVLRRHPLSSAYLLAEPATTPERDLPDAVLHLWRSDDSPAPQWIKKEIRLPSEVSLAPGKHEFESDASFAGPPDDSLCWVDLLCSTASSSATTLVGRKIQCSNSSPFPTGVTPAVDPLRCLRRRRHQARVHGGLPRRLTLSPGLMEWRQDGVFPLEDLWMTDEYRALELPRRITISRERMVWSTLSSTMSCMTSGAKVDFKGQYVLGLDMHCNKIISTGYRRSENLMQIMPRFIVADF